MQDHSTTILVTFAMTSIVKIQMCVCLLKLDFITEILTLCILLMAITCIGMMAYGGTGIYSRIKLMPGYPYFSNINGIEVIIVKLMIVPNGNILAVCRSPSIPVQRMCLALKEVIDNLPFSAYNVILGDFNVNWFDQSYRYPLSNPLITDYQYRQLIHKPLLTTDKY